jgi:tetratricopeptide (TPR) repeat protein
MSPAASTEPVSDTVPVQASILSAHRRASELYREGHHEQALQLCLLTTSTHPRLWVLWAEAAVNCVQLARWDDAITYAERARALGGHSLALLDALAHASDALGDTEAARTYGLQALQLRAANCNKSVQHRLPALPPAPSGPTRPANLIAYGLTDAPGSAETALRNAQLQARLYPHWTCRFYASDTVPDAVRAQLTEAGAQVVSVPVTAPWPAPMWPLLALDDAWAHRVLFRDVDALLCPQEAAAVADWVASGRHFHVMRHSGADTALVPSGQWGAVVGAVPPMRARVDAFRAGAALHAGPAQFLQQFLDQYVWPYARASLCQHDARFGFLGAQDFPQTSEGPPCV